MDIIEKNPNDLIFYENNPRDNDAAVPVIMKSIERFGFRVPVMVDKNNVIICGHTRVKAALELGLELIPCTVEEDMTEEEAKAFRLVENKTHELSFWDNDLLSLELDDLSGSFEMEDFGFKDILTDIDDKGVDNDKLGTDKEISVSDVFECIVSCSSEDELQETYEKLKDLGYKCRIITL